MKKFKKMMALVIAAVMMFAMAVTVFAANDFTNGDGTITVNNAVKGETYYAIKALGATASDAGIDYIGPIPDELASVLEVKTIGTAPNTYQAIGKKDGVDDDAYQAAMRAFATANQANWGTGIQCTANSVTFENLDLGFYVIVSTLVDGDQTTLTNKVSAGSTFSTGDAPHTPNGEVYEKNTKEVVVTKTADESFTIGDTVEYTVTFDGVNYVGEGAAAKIVTKYEVKDTLPEFLKDAEIVSVKIGDTEYKDSTLTDTAFPGVSTFGSNKKFDIPWADFDASSGWSSKYANGTAIKITYTATLTDIVKVDGETGNKNIISITPYGPDEEPSREPWQAHHEVFTYGAALKKVDGSSAALKGAKFKFYGLVVKETTSGEKGNYTVISYDPDSTELGTEMEVGDDGMLYIIGLEKALEVKGKETVAPKGFNLLTSEFTLTPQELGHEIWASSGMKYYDAYGNLVAEETTSETHEQKTKNVSDLDPKALVIVNNAGTELPSTGGIGTTIFYLIGTILVIGAGVLLVTRRRMSAEQ